MLQNILQKIPQVSTLHIVIGAFDGVHLAHQKLITHAIEQAKNSNETSLLFSFSPLPKEYFQAEQFQGLLLSSERKKHILQSFDADYLIISDFRDIKDLSEKEFIELLLTKADKIYLYSGSDFRFGRQNSESYIGNQVKRVIFDDIYIEEDLCRSSNIRSFLLEGNIEKANILLNREYTIDSYTARGQQIGRSIDFPTINVVPTKQLTPKSGVYFGEIKIFDVLYPTAIYVGYRPTVDGIDLRIESHVITDFPYKEIDPNTSASVTFIKRIAEEKSFNSLEELKKMLYNYKTISLGLATERYQK